MKLSVFLLFASLITAADSPSNWPQFRGAGASGIGNGSPPVEWDGEKGKNILWKTDIPGLGHSSPVIWGDRIFVTSAVPAAGESALKVGLYGDITPVEGEGPQTFTVYCLDRRSGKILWQREAAGGQPKIKRHPKSTHANPTPATDGKTLVVSFGSEGFYAFDFNGKQIWKKDFGVLDSGYYVVPGAQWGFASSPVIHGDKVVVQADVQKNSFLAALDLATGKELWRTPRADVPTFGTPAVLPYTAGGTNGWQVVVNGWKQIGGYDLATGKELWKLRGGGDIPVPTPVLMDGLIIITSAHGGQRPIYAIRTDAAGELAEGSKGMAWSQQKAGNYMQTPLLLGGLGYFCYDNGVLTVYQLATGEQLYQQRLGAGTSGFSSSPVAAGDHLYVTNEEGHTYVLSPGREYKLLGENEVGETVMATPAISDGVLYIRARKHLFAVGAKK
ncbi:MAG TPA: PQQ-binding-like beta-propeller repeat protein [Bryobacteraceae bacterium]|nr:PQQ-binding-like beta-propeller repeat protein [Bryobacteraceae bacterium]